MKPEKTPMNSLSKTRRPAPGFTLIELLVVITIIAGLAAVAFFATRNLKSKAYQTKAISSLQQVSTFNSAYAIENNGNINTLRWPTDPLEGPNWVKNSHWGRLQPYIFPNASGSESVLQKSIKQELDGLFSTDTGKSAGTMPNTALSGAKIYRDKSGLVVPFAFNGNMVPWNKFAKTSTFSDPSQIIYFTYGFGMFNSDDGKKYTPIPQTGAEVTDNIYFFDDKKTLAAFLDGHIEALAAPIPDRQFE